MPQNMELIAWQVMSDCEHCVRNSVQDSCQERPRSKRPQNRSCRRSWKVSELPGRLVFKSYSDTDVHAACNASHAACQMCIHRHQQGWGKLTRQMLVLCPG